MASRWVKAGHQVQVITCAPNVPSGTVYEGYKNRFYRREVIDGIQVRRIWTFLAPNAGTVRRTLNYTSYFVMAVATCIFRKKPDVLIATSPQMFCGVAGALLRTIRRWPFVLEIRDIWPESIATVGAMKSGLGLRLLQSIERWMYRRAQRIVTVGPGYEEQLLARGVPQRKICVIPNGIDTSQPPPRSPSNRSRPFCVAYIGTVGMASKLDVMVAAARLAKKLRSPVRFQIIGDGADLLRIRKLIARQTDLPITTTGRVSKSELAELYRSVDACFVHLRDEPLFRTVFPSKILEAALHSKAVINGVPGYAARLVDHSGIGINIPAESENALLSAAVILATAPEKVNRMGQEGSAYFRHRFSIDALADEYLVQLNSL